ncbi:MAG: GNAT family N-acetyltransferase [Clostridia bacterium]|nr:GNAT family N-acetyltransferase [Clostridia bacterium]
MDKETLRLFTRIPTLKTARLVLRKISATDLEDCYEYSSDPEVPKYLLWYPHTERSFTRYYLGYVERKYRRGEFYDWGIELDGKMIGTVGFTSLDVNNNAGEVGYVLNRRFWGLGIATEALNEVLRFGFEILSLERIYAKFIIQNEKSREVLCRCGMREEGVHRHAIFSKNKYHDISVYAITRAEWLENRIADSPS